MGSLGGDVGRWGHADLGGNVSEWVLDAFAPYPNSTVNDPVTAVTGSTRVRRGGHFSAGISELRSAHRPNNAPTDVYFALGVRCARDVS